MPLDAKILGFSNTWYRPAMDHAEEHEVEKDLKIRLVTPVYFCASKLEAFAGRGHNDFHASRDPNPPSPPDFTFVQRRDLLPSRKKTST